MDAALSITVDPRGELPPSEQIAQQVRFAVAAGVLAPGARLPSVRQLALDAMVNPNTVGRAWRELEREGVLESRPGDGVFIASGALAACVAARDAGLGERLARWVDDARSAGLGRDQIEQWLDRALGRGRELRRVGGQRR